MIKRLIVSLVLLIGIASVAQEGTSSPYSFFGLGDMRFRGTAENRAMGGLSVLSDSIHINLQNPAFYPHLKLTSFTLGGSYMTTKLKTNTQEEKARRASLDYLAVAFPIGSKFGAGFGLMPFTAVGYKIERRPTADIPEMRQYNGEGGLNKVFAGIGYRISNNLTIGTEFQYFFGNIETSSVYRVSDVQYGTQELNESAVSGFGLNSGISYSDKITDKLTFSAAASYAIESSLAFSNERSIATIQFLNGGSAIVDEVHPIVADTEVDMPSKFTFGAGIGEAKKWMIGAEAEFRESSNMGNRFSDIENVGFENAQRFTIGGYYIPNYTAFSGYAKRVTYRAGLRYEKTGMVLNGKSIEDAGVTVGFGLPLSGTFSNINLGVEYGKRGTRDAGLVEENYFNFTLGLSFNDRWFIKRKYD